MASDTPKTLIQQSDLNNNGVLDHPNEVAHLEGAIGQRIATMSSSDKREIAKSFTQQFLPKRDASELSEKPIVIVDGVGMSPQAVQKMVNAVRDGVKPEIDSYSTPQKQQSVSESLVPQNTPKVLDTARPQR
jgi:hypothetical protein